MKAITVRNLPPHIAREIRRRAKDEHTSLNGAVIRLLEEKVSGAAPGAKEIRHHDLDFLCGAWTQQEADEFDGSLALQRAIDEELWK